VRHFKSAGPRFRDTGSAAPGTRMRLVIPVAVGVAVVITAAVMLLLFRAMDESGIDMAPVLFVALPLSVLSMAFVIFFIGRKLGGGGITIDTTTGEVVLRGKTGVGLGSLRLQRSEVREVVVDPKYKHHRGQTPHHVRIVSGRGSHTAASFHDPDTAREYGAELASLLSVSLRDNIGSAPAGG